MAQSDGDGCPPLPDAKDQLPNSVILTGADYNQYLQYQVVNQHLSLSRDPHSGNSFTCLIRSPPIDP